MDLNSERLVAFWKAVCPSRRTLRKDRARRRAVALEKGGVCIKLWPQIKYPPPFVEVPLLDVGFISKETAHRKPHVIPISDGGRW